MNMKRLTFAVPILLVTIVFVTAASAANTSITDLDLNLRVTSSSKVTYLQLMQKVFPQATTDLEAETMSDIKQLGTGVVKKGYAGPLEFSFADGFRTAGGSRMVLLFWLRPKTETDGKGEAFTPDGRRILRFSTLIMVLLKTNGEPALLDAVEAEQIDMQPYLRSSNVAGYFWKVEFHANCEKYIKTYTLVSSANDRLTAGFQDLPTIYDDGDCGRNIRQEPYLVIGRQKPIVYLNMVSQIAEYVQPCNGRIRQSYTKYFQYKLRREVDGRLTIISSPKTALRRELVKLGLEYEAETGSK